MHARCTGQRSLLDVKSRNITLANQACCYSWCRCGKATCGIFQISTRRLVAAKTPPGARDPPCLINTTSAQSIQCLHAMQPAQARTTLSAGISRELRKRRPLPCKASPCRSRSRPRRERCPQPMDEAIVEHRANGGRLRYTRSIGELHQIR